jgi:hypothetical protein
MGIRDKPIAPASPWQNGFAERLIGSIRRECLDHIIVSGEGRLRRNLISYAAYYNSVRTHRSLHKDAPIFRPIQQIGIIRSHLILGGFTIVTSGFEFSVHTGVPVEPLADQTSADADRNRQWREVGVGAQILRDLGVSSICNLSSSIHDYKGLSGFGIEIVGSEPFEG